MLILQGVSISNQKGQENPNFEVLPFNKRKMCARYNIVPVSTYLSWEDYQDLGTKWVNHLIYSFYEGNLTLAFAISTLTVSAGLYRAADLSPEKSSLEDY